MCQKFLTVVYMEWLEDYVEEMTWGCWLTLG